MVCGFLGRAFFHVWRDFPPYKLRPTSIIWLLWGQKIEKQLTCICLWQVEWIGSWYKHLFIKHLGESKTAVSSNQAAFSAFAAGSGACKARWMDLRTQEIRSQLKERPKSQWVQKLKSGLTANCFLTKLCHFAKGGRGKMAELRI